MPVYDFECRACGYQRWDKYFTTWRQADEPQECPECGAVLLRLVERPVFQTFHPFDHMTKDGRIHHITSLTSRQEMMNRYGLADSPYSDTTEAKVDPREFKQLIKEEKRDQPERHRKLREKVKVITKTELQPIVDRAEATKCETVKP